MSDALHLTWDELLALHGVLLARYGGLPGFRGAEGQALVASAMQRPKDFVRRHAQALT